MLPQLAVSARILCLLMVMICGAVPSKNRSVRLYSPCAHTYVNVFRNGTVMAVSGGGDQSNLTISTRGAILDLLIYSPIQDMYLCFNRSRLVGRRFQCQYEAEKQFNCLFKQEFLDGYNRYHLVKNKDRYIGFNQRGYPVRRGKSRLLKKQQMCLSFMTESNDFDINRHNELRAGEMTNRLVRRRQRGPPPQNSILPHHGLRHRERHQRRRVCDGT